MPEKREYTYLKDKNNKKIYVGDILYHIETGLYSGGEVIKFEGEYLVFNYCCGGQRFDPVLMVKVGDVIHNKKLLKFPEYKVSHNKTNREVKLPIKDGEVHLRMNIKGKIYGKYFKLTTLEKCENCFKGLKRSVKRQVFLNPMIKEESNAKA